MRHSAHARCDARGSACPTRAPPRRWRWIGRVGGLARERPGRTRSARGRRRAWGARMSASTARRAPRTAGRAYAPAFPRVLPGARLRAATCAPSLTRWLPSHSLFSPPHLWCADVHLSPSPITLCLPAPLARVRTFALSSSAAFGRRRPHPATRSFGRATRYPTSSLSTSTARARCSQSQRRRCALARRWCSSLCPALSLRRAPQNTCRVSSRTLRSCAKRASTTCAWQQLC